VALESKHRHKKKPLIVGLDWVMYPEERSAVKACFLGGRELTLQWQIP